MAIVRDEKSGMADHTPVGEGARGYKTNIWPTNKGNVIKRQYNEFSKFIN